MRALCKHAYVYECACACACARVRACFGYRCWCCLPFPIDITSSQVKRNAVLLLTSSQVRGPQINNSIPQRPANTATVEPAVNEMAWLLRALYQYQANRDGSCLVSGPGWSLSGKPCSHLSYPSSPPLSGLAGPVRTEDHRNGLVVKTSTSSEGHPGFTSAESCQ